MPTVTYKGTKIADSDATVLMEGNQYFPVESLVDDVFKLESSDTQYTCPWKGKAAYHTGVINGETVKDIAWSYPDPKPKAASIKGHICFDKKLTTITV